jgi:hypothetical protein
VALATAVAVISASVVFAQGWSADVSAGRTVYGPLAATPGTSSLVGTVRYDSQQRWIYGAAAVPSGETGTFWTATGAGGRLMRTSKDGRAGVGADLGAHGFWFRDRVVSLAGTGGTLEALPFARLAFDRAFVEGGGGWRGHTLSFAGLRQNRGVFETRVRAGVGYTAAMVVEGAARWVHADEGTFPVVTATVSYDRPRGGLWAQAGKWLDIDVTDHIWGFGGVFNVHTGTSLWATIRREGPDPLYWNLPRRTWSVGLTQRFGRPASAVRPLPIPQDGAVVVRLAAADAPDGAISIAGDFNNWQPAPMVREGTEWVARLTLAPGVYHYAFRSAQGEWFVPASTAGRRTDGMGGYQAVLVVG